MIEYFEGQGNYALAISEANKGISKIKNEWKPISFETFSEETKLYGKIYYITVLFEKVEKL